MKCFGLILGVLEPIPGSYSMSMVKPIYFNVNMPGLEKTENDEALCIFQYMPGVKNEDVKVSVMHLFKHVTLLKIEGESPDQVTFIGSVILPENLDKSNSNIKGEMTKDEMLKLTFPKRKHKQLKTSMFANVISKIQFTMFYIFPSGTYRSYM